IASEREILASVAGYVGSEPHGDDAAVWLQGYVRSCFKLPEEVGGDFAACAKARVKAPVRVVAGKREVEPRSPEIVARTSNDDPAIRLQGDRACSVTEAKEVSGHLAARAEGRIEASVAVVSHER